MIKTWHRFCRSFPDAWLLAWQPLLEVTAWPEEIIFYLHIGDTVFVPYGTYASCTHGDCQLHPIGNDKAPTFLDMEVIKGYSQMLLSDITRVKGYRRTLFTAWLTSRSDDPCSDLTGRPASSP